MYSRFCITRTPVTEIYLLLQPDSMLPIHSCNIKPEYNPTLLLELPIIIELFFTISWRLSCGEPTYTLLYTKPNIYFRDAWKQLMDVLESREQRLNAAGEIHRFHRDVADALSRIQDKDAAISDDLGRDLNSVLTLIRKHEGFENDLVALEAQLQVSYDQE